MLLLMSCHIYSVLYCMWRFISIIQVNNCYHWTGKCSLKMFHSSSKRPPQFPNSVGKRYRIYSHLADPLIAETVPPTMRMQTWLSDGLNPVYIIAGPGWRCGDWLFGKTLADWCQNSLVNSRQFMFQSRSLQFDINGLFYTLYKQQL